MNLVFLFGGLDGADDISNNRRKVFIRQLAASDFQDITHFSGESHAGNILFLEHVAQSRQAVHGAGRISFTYQDLGEMDGDAFVAELEKAGATDIEVAVLNGRNALSYDLVVNGVKSSNVVIDVDETKILTISFAPMDDEGFAELAGILTASIQDAQ